LGRGRGTSGKKNENSLGDLWELPYKEGRDARGANTEKFWLTK